MDGAAHNVVSVALRDEKRDAWLNGQGIRVLRFPAVDILEDRLIDGVLQTIKAALADSLDV